MAFHVGQKVTLKDNGSWESSPHLVVPEFGNVYTIRAIRDDIEGAALSFREIRNRDEYWGDGLGEADWAAEAFRPVKTTSIEIFTAMLTKPPAKTRRVRA